jgi:hypothetical protein
MIKAIFHYFDGMVLEKTFSSREEMLWFEKNEGDHLLYCIWELVQEDSEK